MSMERAVEALEKATLAIWAAMQGVCTNDIVCKSQPCACATIFARAALDAAAPHLPAPAESVNAEMLVALVDQVIGTLNDKGDLGEGYRRERVTAILSEAFNRGTLYSRASSAPAQPALEGWQHRAVAEILVDVAELPDRTSPEDQPDMMLVTANELRDIVLSALSNGK